MVVAKVVHVVCDLCESDKGVSQVTVKAGLEKAWELDICQKCYKSRFGDLERYSHPPARRKRRSFEVVEPL